MRGRRLLSRKGFTLLEALVALVILGLVVVTYLAIFGSSSQGVRNAETWAQAVAYAENAMEEAKLDPRFARTAGVEHLPGGFERSVQRRSSEEGLEVVTVVVSLPGRGRFTLSRLVEAP